MIRCTLGEKIFSVDFFSGRALREIEPALKMYARIAKATSDAVNGTPVEDDTPIADALDVLVRWFCLLFANQFNPDQRYDGYPADRLMHASCWRCSPCRRRPPVLEFFPTKAAQESPKTS